MPSPRFSVTMLPAAHGDGIWIEYAKGGATSRVVIDGGPRKAYAEFSAQFDRLPAGDKEIELFVVSHVDLDHIEAPLQLLAQPRRKWPFEPRDIWFNGYGHMVPTPVLGALQGEFLGALLKRHADKAWNREFGGGAVVIPAAGSLHPITLDGGMTLTLLSPDAAGLEKMGNAWAAELKKFTAGDIDKALEHLAKDRRYTAGEGTLGPGDLDEELRKQLKGADPSKANGTSIAFLAEFGERSILLLADAHMSTVCASLRRLLRDRNEARLKVDAVKVAHHGSKSNTTDEFLDLVEAEHFLFSSDGGGKNHHPNKPVVQAIIAKMKRPTLWFNYRSIESEPWEAGAGRTYATRYPAGTAGVTLDLL